MDYEKLGLFYLGRLDGQPWLYDARDLLTHAVIVGMTGSGKTGLGITLLEEAALDGIPALIVDPKGDLANLALRLDPRDPEQFRPWIDPDAARRAGADEATFARQQADRWARGLAESDQGPERIARLEAASEVVVYTPGSSAVRPLSVVRSFACPAPAVLADADLLRSALASTTSALLALVGLDADPIQSREHVLVATLLERAWRSGQDLDLAGLVGAVHAPAIERVGALPLEAFFPAADREKLAIRLNTLVASPAFAPWLEGEPLDVGALLAGGDKTRLVVLSIAHLGEAERMFFVTLVLGQLVAWMRSQPGTSSLRALLYMDEVAGYLPPVANPASKGAFLTLLKQARAYGLGLVLATQNPVDLDYKALSNAGSWFVGRLQTERDKLRLLDGLEGVGVDRAAVDRAISALEPRRFLVHDVHADGLVQIETRWAMSYLRGPLTLTELARLVPAEVPEAPVAEQRAMAQAPPAAGGLPRLYAPALAAAPTYRPGLLGIVRVHVADAKAGVDHTEDRGWWLPVAEHDLTVDWARAEAWAVDPGSLDREPAPGARFGAVPASLGEKKAAAAWTRALVEHAYRTVRFELLASKALGVVSRPGESEEQLRARLVDRARADRDQQVDALRDRHAAKLRAIEEKIARARAALAEQQSQATSRKVDTAVSVGAAVFGALFGTRGSTLSRVTGTAKDLGRAVKEAGDVDRHAESLATLEEQRADLILRVEEEAEAIGTARDPRAADLQAITLKPKKSDLEVRLVALVFRP